MRKRLTTALLSLAFTWSPQCNAYATDTFMAYDGGHKLKANKLRVAKVCDDAQADVETHATILALGMLETEHLDVKQRDKSRDYNPMMKCYGPFNLNGDLLNVLGYHEDFYETLNAHDGLEKSVEVILKAHWHIGWDLFIRYFRSGTRVKVEGLTPRELDYKKAMEELAHQLMWNPEYLTDSTRVASEIQPAQI